MRRASIDTSHDPTHGLAHALRLAARLLEAEQACSSLTRSHLSPVCVVVLLFVLLAPWSAGGGDRENVALSYVYANSGCVAASWLCVLCEPVFVSVCRSCACRHHLRSVQRPPNTALVSSPSLAVLHLPTYLPIS